VAERTIVDAGPIVALLNAADAHHAWARGEFARREAPFLSCEAALSEAQHLVARGRGNPLLVLEMLHRGALTVALSVEDQVESLLTLQRSHKNLPMSLADACLVRLAELHPQSRVFTTDSHFRVYRRNRRQLIPRLVPRDI